MAQVTAEIMQCTGGSLRSSPHDMFWFCPRPHLVGLWQGEHNPAIKPIKPSPRFECFTTFSHFCHTFLACLRLSSFEYPPHDRPNTKLRAMFQVPTMSRGKTITLKGYFFWTNVELSVSAQQRNFLKGSRKLAPTLNIHFPCPLKMRSGRICFHPKFGCQLCSIRGYNAIYTRRRCTGLSGSCSLFDCGKTVEASGTKSPEFTAQRLHLMGRTDALVRGTQTLCSR